MAEPQPRGSVVLLAAPGDSTDAIANALARRFDLAAVIVEQPISRRTLLMRRAARIGWVRALDQLAFVTVVSPLLRRASRVRLASLRASLGLDEPVAPAHLIQVGSVNAPATIEALRRIGPDVVVVSGTRIISDTILDSVTAPFINLHAGITPRYRGVHGAYWAAAEGRPQSAGVTVHLVDPGIDTGAILAQARIAPSGADAFVTLPYLQLQAGIPLLMDAVAAALDGRTSSVPSLDATASRLWYHPGAIGYLVRRLRDGVR